jgi:hypothetical protein
MTLDETLKFMKANLITSLKLPDGTAIELHGSAFDNEATPPDETPAGPDMDERGRTGMSRNEQLELLGQVFEGDFKRA